MNNMEIINDINYDRVYEIMKDNMNNDEQKLFIQSFKSYLQYGDDDKAFVINLDNVWQWIGFYTKGNSKKFLLKHFIINKDYIIHIKLDEKPLIQLDKRNLEDDNINKNHGGQNKETILMTVNTFKKFCMKASTKRADEICDYYLKMENILQKYIKEKLIETNNLLIQSVRNIELERHEILLRSYSKKKLIYCMKLECHTDDKKGFFVKLGYSDDIEARVGKIRDLFKCPIIILDLFACVNNKDYEDYLLNTDKIIKLKYKNIINNANKSREVIKVKSMDEYNIVKRIIKNNIFKYNYKSVEELHLLVQSKLCDIYKDDKKKLIKALEFSAIKKNINDFDSMSESSNDDNIIEKVDTSNRYIGPKVQIYDGNNIKKLLMVFDSITDAIRKIPKSSYSNIKIAAKKKILYLGYRWFLVDRKDPDINNIKDIGETVISNKHNYNYVAMLNIEKSKIIKVFALQKDASKYISQDDPTMSNAIKLQIPLENYYWILWNDLSDTIKNDYLKNNELPDKINSRGLSIIQINPNTNKIIKKYPSITEASKELHISPKTFKYAMKNDKLYKGFKWKILTNKEYDKYILTSSEANFLGPENNNVDINDTESETSDTESHISETKNIIIKEPLGAALPKGKSDKRFSPLAEPIPIKPELKNRNESNGYKIQKYTLDGNLVCTYKSNMETVRKEDNTSVSALKKAIKDKMIYKKYRWMFLDRDKPDDTIQDIGETKEGVLQNNGYIAMLDIHKKKIVQVFPDQISVGKERKLAPGSVCSAIKRGSLSSGHYFVYYEDCSDGLKEKYLSKYPLPNKIARKNAKVIKQLHPVSKEIIREYNSMTQIQKEFQVSLLTLKKAINEDTILKNFRWCI